MRIKGNDVYKGETIRSNVYDLKYAHYAQVIISLSKLLCLSLFICKTVMVIISAGQVAVN